MSQPIPIATTVAEFKGSLRIENSLNDIDLTDCYLGVQIIDGRVWLCVNGIAFIRFKGERKDVL